MKRCPACRSSNVTLYMGGQFGKHQCKKCGYVGMVLDEGKTLDEKDKEILRDLKEHSKQ